MRTELPEMAKRSLASVRRPRAWAVARLYLADIQYIPKSVRMTESQNLARSIQLQVLRAR